jgi:hypothetical protein
MGEFLNAAGFTSKQAKKAVAGLKKMGAFSQKTRQTLKVASDVVNQEENIAP